MHIYNPITGSLTAVTNATNVWHRPAYNSWTDSILVYNRGDKDSRSILYYNSPEDARKELSEIADALSNREAVYTAKYNVPSKHIT